ncbi:MAG: S-methyl-5-thioribose-1-phosphate isomerase [Bacteroidota bacterium]
MRIPPLHWRTDHVLLLDQTRLPGEEVWLDIRTAGDMAEAIRTLSVRGAPAIGVAAAYGVVLAALEGADIHEAIDELAGTRPTAVNLFWALDRMRPFAGQGAKRLLAEARLIEHEDLEAGRQIGEHALRMFASGMNVLTHCHAGGVATSGFGTALAPLLQSKEAGVDLHVWVDETRPLLQGSRITAWELQKAGVSCTVITDNMAAHVMGQGLVDAVIVGADRIAANGDTANKIGTYGLAVLARAHGIPFYIAAPRSTIDYETASGADIEIEQRHPDEVRRRYGLLTAPEGVGVYNPAFDVTPAALISAWITEEGILNSIELDTTE